MQRILRGGLQPRCNVSSYRQLAYMIVSLQLGTASFVEDTAKFQSFQLQGMVNAKFGRGVVARIELLGHSVVERIPKELLPQHCHPPTRSVTISSLMC